MSYCRFSSDDFQSDVYVYEDVSGGFTTHVASKRRVFKGPLPPRLPLPEKTDRQWAECYLAREREVMRMVGEADLVDIGLPYDGQTFNDPTPGAAADRLEMLRKAGYNVPQSAIDMLREESQEDN